MSDWRDRRGVRRAVWGLVILLGGLYVAGWLLVGNKVPSGTEVAGVDIGGLSPEAARDRLEEELSDRVDQPIQLNWQGRRFELDPEEAGLRVDLEATVQAAGGGRSWNPLRMLDNLMITGEVAPVLDVDETALHAALGRIADQIDRRPIEPRVVFDAAGSRSVLQPATGYTVDREAVTAAVLRAYLRSDDPLQVPIVAVQPTIGPEDVTRALNTIAAPATSGPIWLRLPNHTVRLRVSEFAPALNLRARGGTLQPAFDLGRLAQTMGRIRQRFETPPHNARVVLRRGRPAVLPSRPGRRLDPAAVARAIAPVLAEKGKARTAKVRLSAWEAPFTTADARDFGIRRVVSSFTTRFPPASYLYENLHRAARLINGTVVRPGGTFSFNGAVGPRTRANGFTRGKADRGLAARVGGGVSQVATTAYNAAFLAGLEEVQRVPPTFYNARFPAGRDALVAWPNADLRFKNTTPYGVLIQAWVEPRRPHRGGYVHVRIWSTKTWNIRVGVSPRLGFRKPAKKYDRSRRCRPQNGRPGFDVHVHRYFRRPGSNQLHHEETIRASYLPMNAVVCHPPPDRNRGRRR